MRAILGLMTAAAMAAGVTVRADPDRYLMVRAGTVLTVPGKPGVANATVVVKNGVVEAVVPREQEPKREWLPKDASVEVQDCGGMTVLPGLIDCHVHLTMYFDAGLRLRNVTESNELVTLRAAQYAKRTLEAGFTTVRDLGAQRPETIFAVRDGVAQGLIVGPRIVAAGHPIAITGGHGDFTNGYREDVWGMQTEEGGIADGPDSCMRAVREQIKRGADVIKLTATGGVLSASAAGLRQHFTDEELKAICTAAHMMGRKVAAHAHGADGIRAALAAGVDSIEHGTYLDEESIALIKGRGEKGPKAYLVPTMLAAETVTANADKPGYYLPMVAAKAKLVGPRLKQAVRQAHEAGVPIAFGTDSGVSEHGLNGREFTLLVEAGLTPTETIVAATVTAAELLGLSDQVGTLEAGKAGDMVAVAGDPTKDASLLAAVKVVVKAGVVVKK